MTTHFRSPLQAQRWEFGSIRTARLTFWVGVILIVFSVYDFGAIAFREPYGMHQWRQCDAYSVTLNYARESRGLMDPAMHFQHGDSGGEAVGEFTLTYFLNGALWRATGVQPWTLRWTHLCILLLGFGGLFEFLINRIKPWGAIAVVWLTMSSGLMAFYGPNYLVNSAALGCLFFAWWAADKWWRSSQSNFKLGAIASIALTLAVLFRPTMALGWWPLVLMSFSALRPLRWVVMWVVPLLFGVAWVVWAKEVNALNGSVYYLTSIRPIWSCEQPEEVWRAFREDVLPQWYHRYTIIAIGLMTLVAFVWGRGKDRANAYALATGGIAMGLLMYFLLWFENLNVHDYYLIEFQILVPLFGLWLLRVIEAAEISNPRRLALIILAVFAGLIQFADAGLRTRMKHRPVGGWLSETLLPARERDVWSWFHWDQNRRFSNQSAWVDHLRSNGIMRTDLVISVPDPSPNITLSLMDQKGFTDLYDDAYAGDERIAHYVMRGAKFLTCNDENWYELHKQSPWLTHEMTKLGNFRVFDLLNSDATLRSRDSIPNPTANP